MISFIIPTLNEESVIEKILACLSRYSGEKEIIVSDGGSSDKTAELAARYTDKVLVYRGTVRQNISGGRNAGAAAAKGDFLVFIDADVFINEPDTFFAKALSEFKKNPKLVGITVGVRVFPEMETLMDKIIFSGINFQDYLYNNVFHIGGAPGEFQMVRTESFKKAGGFDEKIIASEDYLFFRALAKVGQTRYVGELTVFHTGRRAHKIGWPKLLFIWLANGLSVVIRKKAASKEWKPIR